MQLAWEALLEQARANREVAQANRVTAEAMLLAMCEAQGFCGLPCHDDELAAWFHDADGVAAIAKATVQGCGNANVESEVMEVPGIGVVSHCATQPPSIVPEGIPNGAAQTAGCEQREMPQGCVPEHAEEGWLPDTDVLDTPHRPSTRREVGGTPPKVELWGDSSWVVPNFPGIKAEEVACAGLAKEVGSSIDGRGEAPEPIDLSDAPGADGGSGADIEELAGALPRPPEDKGGLGGGGGGDDLGQPTVYTGGEGAPTVSGNGASNRGLGDVTGGGSDNEDGVAGNVQDVPPEQQPDGQAGAGGGAELGEDCAVVGRPPDEPKVPPYLLAILIVIAQLRIVLRPAVAQVVRLAETKAAQGIGLIELVQQAHEDDLLDDGDIEQLEHLDVSGLALMVGKGGAALVQQLSEDKLDVLRYWQTGAKPRA